MGTTITKEIEIEIEYDDIVSAVGEMGSSERESLISDCDLAEDIKNEISDDVANFIDENCSDLSLDDTTSIIESALENSEADKVKVLKKVIANLDDDEQEELNAGGYGKPTASETTDVQGEFLKIVGDIIDEAEMRRIVLKYKENRELLETLMKVVNNGESIKRNQ